MFPPVDFLMLHLDVQYILAALFVFSQIMRMNSYARDIVYKNKFLRE